jgi:hypothetical protein
VSYLSSFLQNSLSVTNNTSLRRSAVFPLFSKTPRLFMEQGFFYSPTFR